MADNEDLDHIGFAPFGQVLNIPVPSLEISPRTKQLEIRHHVIAGLPPEAAMVKLKQSPKAQQRIGMQVVDHLFAGYSARKKGSPIQKEIRRKGNAYLIKKFPYLSVIRKAVVWENIEHILNQKDEL